MTETHVVQAALCVLAAVFGTVTVLTRDPLRQCVLLGFQGIVLVALFLSLMAPDVALAQGVVGALPYPVMVLLALARVRRTGGGADHGGGSGAPEEGS